MSRLSSLAALGSESVVNDVLLRHPGSAAVFNAFGVDACCGGDATLAVAAARDGVDLNRLLAALHDIVSERERRATPR